MQLFKGNGTIKGMNSCSSFFEIKPKAIEIMNNWNHTKEWRIDKFKEALKIIIDRFNAFEFSCQLLTTIILENSFTRDVGVEEIRGCWS